MNAHGKTNTGNLEITSLSWYPWTFACVFPSPLCQFLPSTERASLQNPERACFPIRRCRHSSAPGNLLLAANKNSRPVSLIGQACRAAQRRQKRFVHLNPGPSSHSRADEGNVPLGAYDVLDLREGFALGLRHRLDHVQQADHLKRATRCLCAIKDACFPLRLQCLDGPYPGCWGPNRTNMLHHLR